MRATTPETLAIRAYVEDQVLEDVVLASRAPGKGGIRTG
jgi:hypothetical protein